MTFRPAVSPSLVGAAAVWAVTALVSTAAHAANPVATGTWQATLACGAYEGPGQVKNPGPWTRPVTLKITGNEVQWSRQGADHSESLSGLLRDGAVVLHGEGHWTHSPDKPWRTEVHAKVDASGAKLTGDAVIRTAQGDVSRRCTVTRAAAQQPKPAAIQTTPMPTTSFDCRKASSAVEHLICESPALAKLDVSLAAAYKAALARDPSVREQQLAWLKGIRNRCGDVQCLTSAYEAQIEAMRGSPAQEASSASPVPTPAPMVSPAPKPPVPVEAPSPATPLHPMLAAPACPIDWSALASISGPNPDKLILVVKARDWNKERIDQLLEQEAECQRTSTDPDTIKRIRQADVQAHSYPNALDALAQRDQQLQREAQRQQQEALRAQKAEEDRQRREMENAQRAEREAQQLAERQKKKQEENTLWGALAAMAAAFGGWFWNKFIRNRCPKCKSTDYDTTDVSEVDRWRGTKKVTEQHSRGTRTRHVSATYVQKVYSYRCRACQTKWQVSKKEEL